jgi:hypothetical protein
MSFQEKRTLTSILTGVAVLTAYCLYAFNPARMAAIAPGDLKPWAITMLMFIGIGIASSIIIQIVFHILMSIGIAIKEKIRDQQCDDKKIEKTIGTEMTEDERDKLIDLKSSRIGFYFAGFGTIAAIVSIVLNFSAVVMINIVFVSMSLGSLIEGVSQMILYRRGA